jgi:hypothetical protein
MSDPKPARIYLVATSTHPDDKALALELLAGQPGAATSAKLSAASIAYSTDSARTIERPSHCGSSRASSFWRSPKR